MGIRFSADDILRMAERIEKNGAEFYRTAAELAPPLAADSLLALASWEDGHAALFAAIRGELTEDETAPTTYDPDDEAMLYLQVMADGVVFDPEKDPRAELGLQPSLESIYRIALVKEHESIVFYTGMREVVPPRIGRARIDRVIKEEFGHITQLHQQLAALTHAKSSG
ncbi:MAG: ferritin-like domain-containing protein [Armatimonadota bacterium]